MLQVSYKIKIGSHNFKSNQSHQMVDLKTNASLDSPVNYCQIILDATQKMTVKIADTVKIELGYEKQCECVFTGKVSNFTPSIHTITIEAVSALTALANARFNVLYEKQKASAVVNDVLKKLKVKADKVEAGLKFATYLLHANDTVLGQLQTLAKYCGFDFYVNTKDKVVFKKYSATKTHDLTYGIDILNIEHQSLPPAVDGVKVYGESPAGQGQGEDASAWFTKKSVDGKAGKSSGKVLQIIDAAIRNKSLAQNVATNLLQHDEITERGKVYLLGNAKIKLGDAIKVAKMPISIQNGQFKVTAVQHYLNLQRGFISVVAWEKVS